MSFLRQLVLQERELWERLYVSTAFRNMAQDKKKQNKKQKRSKDLLKNICEINGWDSKIQITKRQIKQKRSECLAYIKNNRGIENDLKEINRQANIYFKKRLKQFDKRMQKNINCYFAIRLK